ncbi:hypothetical protein AAHH78_41940, partial [Burkholderia pseudomallei]
VDIPGKPCGKLVAGFNEVVCRSWFWLVWIYFAVSCLIYLFEHVGPRNYNSGCFACLSTVDK